MSYVEVMVMMKLTIYVTC